MRVFSKKKFLENFENQEFYFAYILSQYGENNWVNWLDGKNENEIKQMGYVPIEEAMVDNERIEREM